MERDVFEKHQAKYWVTEELGATVERLVFRDPKCSNYYLDILCTGRSLIVTGDAYEAIYQVSDPHALRWWSTLDAGYLAGKLRGLNGHPEEAKSWDEDKAKKELTYHKADLEKEAKEAKEERFLDYLDEQGEDAEGPRAKDEPGTRASFDLEDKLHPERLSVEEQRSKLWDTLVAQAPLYNQYEWVSWMQERCCELDAPNVDNGEIFFGSDYIEYCGIGLIRNPQVDLHLEGLKKAVGQLLAAGTTIR